jgi:hypothetical protein
MSLPGDDLFPGAVTGETRAITIRAPAERVWPWLAQLGQDRGGFYSYDLLENVVGCRMPTTDVLRPEHQQWAVGDRLWMYPRERGGGVGYATLRTYLPGQALAFAGRAMGAPPDAPETGSWAMVVRPVDDSTSRLIVRGRGTGGRSLLGLAFDRAIFEPAHFVMERRMMTGIGQLAEGGSRHRAANHVQVICWALMLGAFCTALVRVFRRTPWGRPLAEVAGSAVLFGWFTLAQPSAALTAGFTAAWLAFMLLVRSAPASSRNLPEPRHRASAPPFPAATSGSRAPSAIPR